MLLLSGTDRTAVTRLLLGYGLDLREIQPDENIPGSYWGESEAGLRGTTLFARLDTPLHSILHESAHFICMSPERRVGLDRDAGGDDAEESAVCYLQILMAEALAGVGSTRLCADMDAWGYSFRLGRTALWFEQDAQDARAWLHRHGIIDDTGGLTGALRA
ncbi:MAG TPA: hypothetical protein VNZ06_11710 [Steroidobacteraceae bacterium]|jgi:hypothetical protein|nr:hypothetical protein [Steroidobacteraceae bacterium]